MGRGPSTVTVTVTVTVTAAVARPTGREIVGGRRESLPDFWTASDQGPANSARNWRDRQANPAGLVSLAEAVPRAGPTARAPQSCRALSRRGTRQ